MNVAATLTDFALEARPTDAALAVLRLSLLDWACVGLAGAGEPVAGILHAQATEEGGAGQAALIGSAQRAPARMAALVNGTISHALDYDDTHFAHIGHPSVAVIPAALAAAELTGADAAQFQRAALIGVEASIRVGIWLGRTHYQTGFHQTGTAGAFGAALAAGCLLGLDAGQMGHALGLVSTRASGLKSQFGTMGKPMNAGIAAANGIEAACLAAKGFVSDPGALEDAQGFGPTHHGEGDMRGFADIGTVWQFISVQHKFHACCHGLHASLEALGQFDGAPEDVRAVEITTHPRWMSVCNIATPSTGLEAKFSYRMVTAMALLGHDTALRENFTDTLCRDARVTALRDRVTVQADETLSEMQARVKITGQGADKSVFFHDLDADPGLSARQARVQAKAAVLLGSERARDIWRMIETDKDLTRFVAALTGA